ncbi:hypothetical protein [Rickettsia endosymbiont of Halotydeus destructor]|uniref:hypothetical protein n=1 Tax=Rickettsia endosymbiont of Halotydeus destructor TaxID=2996754 RepID=UPI003BB193DD
MTEKENQKISSLEEQSEEEYKAERKRINAKVWKDTKDMLKIILPALVVVYILMQILNGYLIERHSKAKALEIQQISDELDAEEAAAAQQQQQQK